MRITLFFCLIAFCFLGCKKEFKQPDLVGRWEFNSIVRELVSGPLALFDFDAIVSNKTTAEYGNIQLEITKDSQFIFNSKKGTQKFRVIKAEPLNAEIRVYDQSLFNLLLDAPIEGFVYHLRSGNGVVFKFHFYYESYTNRIITVPWVKNLAYDSKDRPYMPYGSRLFLGVSQSEIYYSPIASGTTYQMLADFNRVE